MFKARTQTSEAPGTEKSPKRGTLESECPGAELSSSQQQVWPGESHPTSPVLICKVGSRTTQGSEGTVPGTHVWEIVKKAPGTR